jgi:predicted CoA-substrate-specific enzyme activase
MRYVGVDIGALSVKVVALTGDDLWSVAVPHRGRPVEVLEGLLSRDELSGPRYVGVAGHLGHISEAAAIGRALLEIPGEIDAVASLGGESFLVYVLSGKRVFSVLSHNKCAAGSGEFFVQQIGRMGLEMEDAIRRSFGGKVVPLASRCSVHCKSDITHKLNRQEATAEDILHTLHESMADKVVALLEKSQKTIKRLLLIGGVTRNAAMVAALQRKLAEVDILVLPESACFEAWGAALLTRDQPRYGSPHLAIQPTLGRLPPLLLFGERVRLIGRPTSASGVEEPFVLGVDAGSTTTKAVLMDLAGRKVLASHYGRTRGDPVAATRECLRSLVEQVGNREICLVATTGSAREIVGAYLGTEHVFNEISAHARGAAGYDPQVDTIFEIGGQDSKYIYLRNGVPVDYAMNAACSAGTGSFLEEVAQGDLGIPLGEIAEVALAAASPVQFKDTCAAFINSDIRVALQEGYSREDIAAGLIYAIANNYLTKVKGRRRVGNKVFLQGGVALNPAVAHAFAHRLGREVVVPPSPELLGAQGVAILALERSTGRFASLTDLTSLATPALTRLDSFTCKACRLYCRIDRFEVAGRRFPFGGRCSLYENVWKRKARSGTAPDLVAERGEIVFSPPSPAKTEGGVAAARRIGIPRALSTHSLYPLFATFFSRLGMEVVLSAVDARGELKAYSGFCFPAQIAHGAVLDLIGRGVDFVFFPHVSRMPNPGRGKDSYLCPITQAGPYVLAQAFPEARFVSPELDFSSGYASSRALVDMAISQLGASRQRAQKAFEEAVAAQQRTEQSLQEMGERALREAVREGRPTILLVGRSYNAFTPEASQSVAKKLASRGLTVIPADCLTPPRGGATSWHFANLILNAVALARQHRNLFILYVSNFSCTIDSFTQALLASEMGSKPYLILEIDSHTADAGIQTRLEAFLDIVGNYREEPDGSSPRFTPTRLVDGGKVHTSSGERLSLRHPRVKVHFPAFSDYHHDAWAMAARWLGLHPGEPLRLSRRQLERGLQNTSGRECLPLPITIGQLLEVHERKAPGEIAGFYMVRGGAPCATDAFMDYFERFIAQQELPDLFVFSPHEDNRYCGFDVDVLTRSLSAALTAADLLVEIEQSLRVVGRDGSVERLREEWKRLIAASPSPERFEEALPRLAERVSEIPRARDPATCPRVVVTGDFFTRFSPFFMEGVPELYAEKGIILEPAELGELALYTFYDALSGAAQEWGLEPGYRAAAKACTRFLQPDGRNYLAYWKGYRALTRAGARYRKVLARTGLLVARPNDIALLFQEASKHISPVIFGEAIPTVGKALEAEQEGYDGVLLVGPFNCLPFRVSEAILKPLCQRRGMPLLAYESDGYAVSPWFMRQVEVHIQQVLDRHRGRASLLESAELPAPA